MNVSSEGPRAARPLVRLIVIAGAALMLSPFLGACSDEGGAEVDVQAPLGEGGDVIERAGAPTSAAPDSATNTPRPTPMAIAFATRSVEVPDRPDLEGADFRPGPWSPDGRSLVVWRAVGEDDDARQIGRLGIVDAADAALGTDGLEGQAPSLVWESGDVETKFETERAAQWLRDGTLVVARSDGMLVQPDGEPVSDGDAVTGLRGQVREVLIAPNGRSWLAMGSDRTWLVGTDRVARELAGSEVDGAQAWSWRSDSAALAVAVAAKYFTLDVESAAVELVIEIQPLDSERAPPPPRWLAGGKLFVTAPAAPSLGGLGAVHHVVEPIQRSAIELHSALGLQINPVTPYDGSNWVSPDGRYVLYPEVVESDGNASQRASWIYDVPGERAREHPPVGNPTWSPDGRRFTWVEAGVLLVGDIEAREPVAPAEGVVADGTLTPVWSPDGRWLLFSDEDGAAQLVRADGLAGPERLAAFARWSPPPTWSPAGDRFAVSIGDGPDATQLVIVHPSSQ